MLYSAFGARNRRAPIFTGSSVRCTRSPDPRRPARARVARALAAAPARSRARGVGRARRAARPARRRSRTTSRRRDRPDGGGGARRARAAAARDLRRAEPGVELPHATGDPRRARSRRFERRCSSHRRDVDAEPRRRRPAHACLPRRAGAVVPNVVDVAAIAPVARSRQAGPDRGGLHLQPEPRGLRLPAAEVLPARWERRPGRACSSPAAGSTAPAPTSASSVLGFVDSLAALYASAALRRRAAADRRRIAAEVRRGARLRATGRSDVGRRPGLDASTGCTSCAPTTAGGSPS